MTAPRFTDEQLRAIERRDGGLLLAAGAGSGKTSVLVERFARAAIEDGVPVDAILAITFTEKAAAELKARVRARFADAGRHDLARAAEGAFVSTIHGFCSRLLRTHALAAGIDPEYRVLDALESERVGVDAFDRALSAFLHEGADAERLRLVAAYTPARLEAMVRTAYGHLRSRGQLAPELPRIDPPRPAGERERLERAARAALAELGAAAGVRVDAARAALERCLDVLAAADGDELDAAAFDDMAVGRGAGALKSGAFDGYRDALGACAGLAAHQAELHDHALLRDLLRAYGERYEALKRERSGLDFDDLELRANELLRCDGSVRERWSERFRHVMVDEFQDTNPLQNELLERIAGPRLFRVGDELQSIYRFRHADVSVFREQAERARADGRREALTVSFRSRQEILDAVAVAFGAAWGDGFQPLRAGRADADAGEPGTEPCVELIVADRPHQGSRWRERFEADAEAGGPAPELAFGESLRDVAPARAAEARMLAKRVDGLLAEGRFEPGDVVVLLRATTHLAAYERALEDRNVPTYVVGGRGYWSQQQVGDLRAYLGALANPLDELALYTALASPLGGVSLDALVVLAAAARAAGTDPWTQLLALLDDGDARGGTLATDLGEQDAGRARAFARMLRGERSAAPRTSLEALIDRCVTRSGYDLHLLAQPNGRRRMANVRKLMRLAREFEAEEGRDLRAFVDYVAERDELAERQGEAPLEAEDVQAVRLMTVHRAKGLEFPVVCVADLGKPGREDQSPLRISDDGSVGISLAQLGGGSVRSSRLDEIREAQRLADEEEEKRVFYVAATRAEEHLILSGATDLEKLPEEKPLEEPMRWLWRALVPQLPDLGADQVVERTVDGRRLDVRASVLRPDTLDDLLGAPDRAPAAHEPPPAGLDALDAPALAAVPPPSAPPVSRISYSGLQRYAECGYRFYLERALGLPRLERELPGTPAEPATGLPATVRGSVVHELLERLDFERPAAPAPAEVARLVAGHGESADDDEVAEMAMLVERFGASALRARIAAAERVRTELGFAFLLTEPGAGGAGLLVNGIVDVHAVEPDRTLIVDYKTDRLGDRDPRELVDGSYATQRLVYALAALHGGARRVEVLYAFLERPGEPVGAVYEAADAADLERRLRGLAAGISGGRFAPSEQPRAQLCADCPGQPGLCSWDAERTLALEPA
ncbi:MAG: UvrD-helicase domain-containing protein [Thermoleophilaceae bacterium]